jgi:hypothetical protein
VERAILSYEWDERARRLVQQFDTFFAKFCSAASYRFDDPAGEVGIEALLLRRPGEVFHLLCRVPGGLAGHPAARRCLVAAWKAGAGVVAVSA